MVIPYCLAKLEIDEDLQFQRRSWKLQRLGWGLILLITLAALLGLLGGPGLLSDKVAGNEGGLLWLRYEGFGRFEAPTTLEIHLGPGTIQQGRAHVIINLDYLRGFQIQQVTPPPESVQAGLDELTYFFQVANSALPTIVTFDLEAKRRGLLHGRLSLAQGQVLNFTQFIYP